MLPRCDRKERKTNAQVQFQALWAIRVEELPRAEENRQTKAV
jgi:hypothetical protein